MNIHTVADIEQIEANAVNIVGVADIIDKAEYPWRIAVFEIMCKAFQNRPVSLC
ncbi:hypothetical protein Q1W73_08850 [Asticcacaulis sp. ZE23SCel15]|uniref:hypothetical protein n=1 Tax=Asticcacaulis sp. ZE23SCel15 TaxID=3059027 RepID=UPI00265F15B3|nr:hypothetical protein [Asticcacaulis sp. ZE23SCel15]WKL55815.1 hypothetical protein Q1W73_08850 [Asticcacaulis sp. ZE23SCel15]